MDAISVTNGWKVPTFNGKIYRKKVEKNRITSKPRKLRPQRLAIHNDTHNPSAIPSLKINPPFWKPTKSKSSLFNTK
jgi:hypothetical protein